MEDLSLAYVQTELYWEKAEQNRNHFEELIAKHAAKTDIIILPEMFTTGFSMQAEVNAEDFETHLCWFNKITSTYNVAVTGSVMCKVGHQFYNRLIFMKPNGDYSTYDKHHLFSLANEQNVYSAGHNICMVNYKGWKICPLICYDLRFPVWSRNTQAYDVLIYVANWPEKRILAWDALLKARAIENMSYCIGVNRIGKDGNGVNYVGHSAAYDYLGQVLSNHHPEAETVTHLKLNYKAQQNARQKFAFLNDRDHFTLN